MNSVPKQSPARKIGNRTDCQMLLRVLDRGDVSSNVLPEVLSETAFNSRTKLRTCIRAVQEFRNHDISRLQIQVCRISPDGRWKDNARAADFFDFRQMVVEDWVFGRIRQGGLRCHFQPIVESFGPGKVGVYGHEALIRCKMSDDLTLNAGELFSLVWSNRLRRELHTAALWCCLRGSHLCRESGKLFLNIDPCQIDTTGDFWNRVNNLLGENSFLPSDLVFEIVESDRARDTATIVQFCAQARSHGIAIALDDFGAQFDPYHLLLSIRPEIIKLESSLVRGCMQDSWKRLVVENLVRLARELRIKCVVEGIEDEMEWHWAVEHQVPLIQGYRFGRPAEEPVILISPYDNRPESPFFGHSARSRAVCPPARSVAPAITFPSSAFFPVPDGRID